VVAVSGEPGRELEVVEAEIVGEARTPAVRGWQSQAERDRTVEHADEVFATLRGAMAPNTVLAYQKQWRKYLGWCSERDRTPIPASRETLLSYLGWLDREGAGEDKDGVPRGVSVSTVRIAMAALKRVHRWGGDQAPEWVGGDQQITDWLIGFAKRRARDPKYQPKRAAGARQVIMRALLDALGDERPYAIRDRAILLLGYYMAARRSELANLRVADVRITPEGLEVYVAYSKTDQAGDGNWVAVPANDAHPQYDPVTAVMAWLEQLADAGLRDGPLFRPINKHGQVVATTAHLSGTSFQVVMDRVVPLAHTRAEAAFKAAKRARKTVAAREQQTLMGMLDPDKKQLSPHSLRRGFATEARFAGWDLLDISRHGRWSAQSKVVHIYIEEADRWLRHNTMPMGL
jgi:integrase